MIIGKDLIDSLLFHYNKAMCKLFKNKLNMINKTYLHPIRTSAYSSSIYIDILSPESSPHSILELPLLSYRIFYPPPHSPKNL